MDHLLLLLLLLCSSGVLADKKQNASDPDHDVKLVGGASRCAGTLEMKNLEEWRPANVFNWKLETIAAFCEHLDCGSAVSLGEGKSTHRPVWSIDSSCVLSLSNPIDCATSYSSSFTTELVCSDSVRLLDGTSHCSGRLEVKTNQTNQRWASVCEADFDLQDAEVVCRELGCGAPSVLQGALYGEVQAPMWSAEFQCGGHESALLDCRSSGSVRNSCSPAKAVGLTCSDPDVELRLVGGASRCAGTLELKHLEDWRPVNVFDSNLKSAAVFCEHLDCGSAVYVRREESTGQSVWNIFSSCEFTGSHPMDCATSGYSLVTNELVCSDSVRLLDGTSHCSGRLEVKTNQTNQQWASVCEADFDLQDAEVVCRELGCGAPSVLQGALYGEVQAPMWSAEFQCGGQESALLDCRSSGSVRNSCSPAKAVGLTCSDPEELRLVGGASHCAGTLEMKNMKDWRPVSLHGWNLKTAAAVFCEHLDCGSGVSIRKEESTERPVWHINPSCDLTASPLIDCATSGSSLDTTELMCSDSVRLLDGTSHCSGRLEVKTSQTNQRWASVCEADFDLQDAEVVCRELGCGAPSVLQGALYGEVQAPMWSAEFQCGGHESALLDCRSSGSVRNSCSPAKAVGLTCSDPEELRLVGGASRCAGTLELKHLKEWRPLAVNMWNLKTAAVFCEHLDCGSAVYIRREESNNQYVWSIHPPCDLTASHPIDCATSAFSSDTTELVCSDLLLQPIISVSSSFVGVSEAQHQGVQMIMGSAFTIGCSIQPQYPGGFFQLTFASSNSSHSSTQTAVNHSAHFLFPAAEPTHQGNYSCVYYVHVFNHTFSSGSHLLVLSVSDPTALIIRWVLLPLILLLQLLLAALWFHWKTSRGQSVNTQKNMEQVDWDLGVGAAEGGSADVDEAQEAESVL